MDAQRAMRLIRANSVEWGLDPGRIGILGFSAGGHLAAQLANGFDRKVYAPVDVRRFERAASPLAGDEARAA